MIRTMLLPALLRPACLIIVLSTPGWAVSQETTAGLSSSASLHMLDPKTPQGIRNLFQYSNQPLPIVSAHRGGAQTGLPENCIATFEKTLQSTFAILEIDPRFTKDGKIVVHHDATLERTTTGNGRVADWTLEELKNLRLKDPQGVVTAFEIPNIDDVLAVGKRKDGPST